jgi:hypothetical protein
MHRRTETSGKGRRCNAQIGQVGRLLEESQKEECQEVTIDDNWNPRDKTKMATKKSAPRKRAVTGAAKTSQGFAGGKEGGGWSVRQSHAGGKHSVTVKKGGHTKTITCKSKDAADAAFVNAVVNAKG